MSNSGMNVLPWTQEEDAELVRLRTLGLTYVQCAKAIGTRTASACAFRYKHLTSGPARQAFPAARPWTPEEDAELRELWHVLSVEQISDRIGRTAKGIYRRAARIGLTSGERQGLKKSWTPEEDAVLKENVGTMTFAEIGALLGRTDKSVKARALHLCLRGGPKPRLPRLERVTRRCHDCGKPTPDYRCPACWRKLRKRLGCPVEEEPIND